MDKNNRSFNFIPLRSLYLHKNKKFKRGYILKQRVDIFKPTSFPTPCRVRVEYNDHDYIHKLNEKERDWLYRFNREYLNADFSHGGKILHKSRRLRLDCYSMNNRRNRDIYSKARATFRLDFLGDDVFKLVDDKFYFYDTMSNELREYLNQLESEDKK